MRGGPDVYKVAEGWPQYNHVDRDDLKRVSSEQNGHKKRAR